MVPETDDPTLPVMTFRSWVLGLASCCLLIFLNTFFTYRSQPLAISAILMQIAVLPIGRFMASTLPNRDFHFLRWKFSLNPGPFNMKEHVIITIFANCGISYGGGDAYSIGAITVMKAYYKQSLNFFLALLIVLTTQVCAFPFFSPNLPPFCLFLVVWFDFYCRFLRCSFLFPKVVKKKKTANSKAPFFYNTHMDKI